MNSSSLFFPNTWATPSSSGGTLDDAEDVGIFDDVLPEELDPVEKIIQKSQECTLKYHDNFSIFSIL